MQNYKAMKKLLFIAFLLFASCQKDEVTVIPQDIYGYYTGNQSCQPTYSSNPHITVSANDAGSIKLDALRPWTTQAVTVNCDGNELSIPIQTFTNTGSGGGTVTIAGSGDYKPPFINLNVTVNFSSGQNYTCTVLMSK